MPGDELRIAHAELAVPGDTLAALAGFYGEALGLACERSAEALSVRVGAATLAFTAAAAPARPFHHFALLVPGDRFDAAHAWLGERAELLGRDGGGTVFAFGFWDAHATYVHDPAGNIVELIAHHGHAEDGAAGAFSGAELAGLSEVGIVTPGLATAAAALERELGLELWSGAVEDDATGLGFVGRKAHTLILAGPGRGWLPTGRPAEVHPVGVTLTGGERRELVLPGAPGVRVRRTG
jgi:catechol 2,3-dioxygenase-like lactoylglutathione lyase family enzyme